ncbi:hypothetical protein LPJ56_001055 [Coemansia sp. RSA 2599]|nr:hypothetical protein LPJ56_001055 [Coemansia sp. RSA 2599]
MASTATVADCSSQRYCTQTGVALEYGNQLVVHWNNQFPPLTPESLVTVSVFSVYDQTTPIYQITGVDNTNGMVTLKPDASWFSRYTGNNSSTGENQQVFFAAYLQGNEPPAVSDMLSLQLTATPDQYRQIQSILHPAPTAASTAASSPPARTTLSSSPSESETKELISSAVTSLSLSSSSSATSTGAVTETASSLLSASHSATGSLDPSGTTASTTGITEGDVPKHGRDGLSPGAIAGIAVGSAIGLLLILLLLLLPLYRRRQHKRRMYSKSTELASASPFADAANGSDNGNGSDSDGSGSPSSGGGAAGAGAGAAAAAVGAGLVAATSTLVNEKRAAAGGGGRESPSDTPLLVGGKPNNSFTSQDGSISESATHMSPSTVYHPLSLDSPRVMMHMPSSTRSSNLVQQHQLPPPGSAKMRSDPILSSDEARQIGDIFRDALRKPPASEEDASDGLHRDSLLDLDDELGEEEDPGWRERVASERMQRELQQEASVIRSVAMRAHGSDYSSSRPATSRSDNTTSPTNQ